jgi:hypothetical protein
MAIFSFSRPVRPPTSSHALLSDPQLYTKTYENFKEQRKRSAFRLRDSSLASLLRMYEMLLCGLGNELGQEAEYFLSQKWRVKDISDPIRVGWEHDLERERILQALAIVLVDVFNYQIRSGESSGAVILHSIPTWAQPLLEHTEIDDLYRCYPSLGYLFFYLPWRQLSFIYPPRSLFTIIEYAQKLVRDYRHRDKLMSLPLFAEKDEMVTSLCRAYELSVVMRVMPEMAEVFDDEMEYLTNQFGHAGLKSILDPRTRWDSMDVKEPEAFRNLVQFIKMIAQMEAVKGQSLPSWVIDTVGSK